MNLPPLLLDTVQQGQQVGGFESVFSYTDHPGDVVGGRFRHLRTGFTLDLLFIETAPQAFIWVNTFPTSDKGEPHTQEHLLLGKGNKGRHVASLEEMSLAESSAFTMQWRTCYHFHTTAGMEGFWKILEAKLDGLLHPDYTDEEIRREVRNFGVVEDTTSGALRLEEKGTVYSEMVRSFEAPGRRLFRKLGQRLYGPEHPLAVSSGGFPAAIRTMTAEDIRKFHHDNYHLGNMGAMVALPRADSLGELLAQATRVLDAVQSDEETAGRVVTTEADLPAPEPSQDQSIALVPYPHSNPQKAGTVALAWPPTLDLDGCERILAELFLDNIAGDDTSTLYKHFVDSKTRVEDLGASRAWSWLSTEKGNPFYIGLSDVRANKLTADSVAAIRDEIIQELRRISSWPDGSTELREFNERALGRVTEARRSLDKFLNTPPGFGYRGTGAGWMRHLHQLAAEPGYRKSLALEPELDHVESLLKERRNIWTEHLRRWGLTETTPFAAASVADPALIEKEADERTARSRAETDRLAAMYGTTDEAEALRRYRADYDQRTAELRAAEKASPLPPFTDSPPMTLDDQLVHDVRTTSCGVPLVASNFETMTGGTVGIAFRLDKIPADSLFYLAALTALMTEAGIYQDGVAISHEEVKERLRREILGFQVYYSSNSRSGRVELVARGSGLDLAETRRALEWMLRVLQAPDWRPENLDRLRDVLDQVRAALRNTMQGAEEYWVHDPAGAYWRQHRRLFAHTTSFLTRAHDVHRLRWMLEDAGDAADEVATFLEKLASAGSALARPELGLLSRCLQGTDSATAEAAELVRDLGDTAKRLSPEASGLVEKVGKDLGQLLADIPDDSLARDWDYLCRQIRHDLLRAPEQALSDLHRVRERIANRENARAFAVASNSTHAEIASDIDGLLEGLSNNVLPPESLPKEPYVLARLRQRVGSDVSPVFVGLVNPDTQGGVFVNTARGYTYLDQRDEDLLSYLSSNLFTGHGAHSVFMKTWAAGLAYSNGLRGSLATGRLEYYAERCPELPQTLRFVVEVLRDAKLDPNLGPYAVAQAFGARAAASYEGRGEAIASDLTDGVTPEVVRGFRNQILRLAKRRDLASLLFDRMEAVYGRVLPGYGAPCATVPEGVYFVIGPEKQLDRYQDYLQTVEGKDARVYRLYPRDYWIPARLPA